MSNKTNDIEIALETARLYRETGTKQSLHDSWRQVHELLQLFPHNKLVKDAYAETIDLLGGFSVGTDQHGIRVQPVVYRSELTQFRLYLTQQENTQENPTRTYPGVSHIDQDAYFSSLTVPHRLIDLPELTSVLASCAQFGDTTIPSSLLTLFSTKKESRYGVTLSTTLCDKPMGLVHGSGRSESYASPYITLPARAVTVDTLDHRVARNFFHESNTARVKQIYEQALGLELYVRAPRKPKMLNAARLYNRGDRLLLDFSFSPWGSAIGISREKL
jgi:hypothetical protein